MTENQIAKIVVDLVYNIHRELGPGLFESVYETILIHELEKLGMKAKNQIILPIVYKDISLQKGFRVDIMVKNKVLVELKSLEILPAMSRKQLLTYLRLSHKRLGLLINFGCEYIKDGIFRVVNGLPE